MKKIGAYIYLYISFILIYTFFAYFIEAADKPWGTALVAFFTAILFIMYALLNRRVISGIVKRKALLQIEIILLITILTQFVCYCFLWARFGHIY